MHNLKTLKLELTKILEISFFLFVSSDSSHKMMLLESLNTSLNKCHEKGSQNSILFQVGSYLNK